MMVYTLAGISIGNYFDIYIVNISGVLFFTLVFGFTLGPVTWAVIPTLVRPKEVSKIFSLLWINVTIN